MKTRKNGWMITFFTDTCVASVKNNPKNQYDCDQHQSPSNTSSNHSCFRACFLCDKNQDSIKFTFVVIWNGFTEKSFVTFIQYLEKDSFTDKLTNLKIQNNAKKYIVLIKWVVKFLLLWIVYSFFFNSYLS